MAGAALTKPTVEKIVDLLSKGAKSSGQVAEAIGISRQVAHYHLSNLVKAGRVLKTGRTRATRYSLPALEWRLSPEGLDESEVWREEIEPRLSELGLEWTKEATRRAYYAFTEMLNNAIDHSSCEEIRIRVERRDQDVRFEVADDGQGVFEHVQASLGLESPLRALEKIHTGKLTTMPEGHSGEGIFFTSRAVVLFRIASGRLEWVYDGLANDRGPKQLGESIRGTRVIFDLDPSNDEPLEKVFQEYTAEDADQIPRFDKTEVVVKLYDHGANLISRSQAKRITSSLGGFGEVVLDFEGVEGVGQGFVDQLFRVYLESNPHVTFRVRGMNEVVEFMVSRSGWRP